MKKKSYYEIYEFFKSKGLKLLDKDYYGNYIKMNCTNIEGYKFFISYNNLLQCSTPTKFGNNNPYTMENMDTYISKNRKEIEFVKNQKWINNNSKLTFKCLIHNEEFSQTWGNFQSGQGCPKCGREKTSNSRKFTIEMIREKIIGMSKDEEVELVSTEYINAQDNLVFKCLIHNKEFPMTWSNFSSGKGCKLCYTENRGGENHPMWKGGITSLNNHLRNAILKWKYDSFKECDKTCDITGVKSRNNIIHHLHPFSEIVKETMAILDLPIHQEINKYSSEELKSIDKKCLELHYKYGLGVCLTKDSHKEFHLIYGQNKGDNTKEQYKEFKEMKIKINSKNRDMN